MNYEILKEQTNTGWNTWNTSNVLSHVLLPYGFSINLCIKAHGRVAAVSHLCGQGRHLHL